MTNTAPIRTNKCHCGNVTESGLGRKDEPSKKSKKPCCLLCRCDEHSRVVEYRATDQLPGCGPMCAYHPYKVRMERLAECHQSTRLNGVRE